MKIFKIINSKIRFKLIFGFVFISLFAGATSYFGLSTIQDVNSGYKHISTEHLPLLQHLSDMKFASIRLVSSITEYAYIKTESKGTLQLSSLEQESSLIQQSCKSCHKAFSQYEYLVKESFPELIERTNEIRKNGNVLHITANKFLDMKKQGISGTEALEKKEEMEVAEMEFLNVVTQTINFTNEELKKENTLLETTISSALTNIFLFSGFAFFISVLIGILYSYSISKPITKLTHLANDFRDGNLDATVEIKANDEIGVLAKSFHEMAAQIRQLVTQLVKEIKTSKQVGESLKKSNQQTKLILEVAGEGIFGIDLEGNLTSVNPMASKILGYEVEELLGKHSHKVFHHSYNDGTFYPEEKCAIYETLRSGMIQNGEDYYWRKDGTFFPIEFSSLPIIENEIITGAVVTFSDITNRKRREIENQVMYDITHSITTTDSVDELLKLIHQSLKKVIYAENCFVTLHDQNTGLFSFPFYKDKFDPVPAPAAMRKSCTAYVFRTKKTLLLTQALFDRLLEQNEVELVGSNSPSWIGIPLQIPDRIIGVLVLQHYEEENVYSESDVNFLYTVGNQIAIVIERKLAEETLRENETKLKVILESTADGILAVDGKNKIIKTNKRFAELWRIPQFLIDSGDDFTLMNFVLEQLIDAELFISKMMNLKNSTNEDLDKIRFKDGRIFERYSAPLLMKDSSVGRVWSFRDITDLVRSEEEIKKRNEQLSKLIAEKDKFFAIIAHDLKNPFQGLLGLSELMAMEDKNFTKTELLAYSKDLHKSASNLFKLLENLLEWAQIQQSTISFTPQKIDLHYIVTENIEVINQRALQKGITIINEVPVTETAYADNKMVDTVLRNLLSNAVKFTNRNGKVTIQTKNTDNKMLQVSVSDTGIGISAEDIGKLFKIEEKVSSRGTEGELSTGIGLLLCQEFVKKNGGKIWFESEEEKGSTFYFSLPKYKLNVNIE